MVAVRISDQADRALLEALIYIYQDNPVAAVDLIADLQKRIVFNAEFFQNLMGRLLHDLGAGVVVFVHAMTETHQAHI